MYSSRKKLTISFWTAILLPFAIAALYETELLTPAWTGRTMFLATAALEAGTLILLPSAPYLFKTSKVRKELEEKHSKALQKWGLLRIAMTSIPLLLDTLLYYNTMNVSFAYLAIICLICMIFIYPSKDRCENEANYQE